MIISISRSYAEQPDDEETQETEILVATDKKNKYKIDL